MVLWFSVVGNKKHLSQRKVEMFLKKKKIKRVSISIALNKRPSSTLNFQISAPSTIPAEEKLVEIFKYIFCPNITFYNDFGSRCIPCCLSFILKLKGNAQFVEKVTFETLMDFKQNHHGSWKY